MSVPQTILASTFRLLRFGTFITFIGVGISGHLQYQIVLCIAFFVVVDCWVVHWLRASHDSDAVTKITRRVCNTCQLASFISQIACMQFYDRVPMVRAAFLMTIPSFLAGCSRDATEASVVLLASFTITASCESEPAFLLSEMVLSSWMIFGAWKGQKLIEQTQQEATLFFVQCSERMMQQALTVLLDCTVVMEQVAPECAPPSAELGGPTAEAIGAPQPAVWRVLDGNPSADHFFGAPMAGVDLRDMIRPIADHRRFDEALQAAAQSGEHARMVSNVSLRCSTLAGAAASLVQRGPSAGAIGTDQHFVDCKADLVVIGRVDLPQPEGLRRRRTVFVGVRTAQREPSQSAALAQRRHRHRPRDPSRDGDGGDGAAPARRRSHDPPPPSEHRPPDIRAAAVRKFSMADLRYRALPSVAKRWKDDFGEVA